MLSPSVKSAARMILAAAAFLPCALRAGEWDPWERPPGPAKGGEIRIAEETNVLKIPAILAIRAYQTFISPLAKPVCRFRPSCSRYTLEAISFAGPVNGVIMGAERLSRCHACASPALYHGAAAGLINDPARGKPVPLPLFQWFGF